MLFNLLFWFIRSFLNVENAADFSSAVFELNKINQAQISTGAPAELRTYGCCGLRRRIMHPNTQ